MRDIPHIYRRDNNGARALLYTWFGAMHSRVDIAIVSDKTEEPLMQCVESMRRRIADIERTANCFSPESELAAINRHAADRTMHVGNELETIIASCMRYNAMTNGLFDITVDSEHHNPQTIRDISLPGDGTIRFRRRGIRINLSGFLKGYALEQLRTILRDHDITDALLNMGNSSVMAIGNMTAGAGWGVGFGNRQQAQTITLRNQCLTTSGNDSPSRQHITDPATGQKIQGQRSIAVINGNASEGEALSTSLFIKPEMTFPRFGEYSTIASRL